MLATLGLTALFTKLRGYLIELFVLIILGVGAYIYITMNHQEIVTLKQQFQLMKVQADAQKASNADLQKQIIAVTKREDEAANDLSQIRINSGTQTQVIIKQNLHTPALSNPSALQDEVNAQTQKLFDDISAENGKIGL